MKHRGLLLAAGLLVAGAAESAQWKAVTPIQGTTAEQPVVVKGKPGTYHRAMGLRLNVTGPGGLRVISRWIGPRPARRDTSYSLGISGGTRRVTKAYSARKSGIAGVPGRKLWVSRSRTAYVAIPPKTTQIALTCADPNVYVKVLFSQKPSTLGKLMAKAPDRYADVVRLERKEREVKYYRATAQLPVELEIIGPTTLVMYSRLEFTYDMKGIQNYQVQVTESSQMVHSFTWSVERSDVTRHLDRDDLVPSAGKRTIIQVPAGLHRWSFKPGSALDTIILKFFIPEKDI
ncbi:MAG: hypothetical protein MUE60_06355 [Candidatus Eisenbacteria bacterium]|jgi:hypothetical protein|nr:hypothetical protein [Candidatus Eisenbacteria bacterium]